MRDSNVPFWLEKRITACWLFGWAFILSIFIPDEIIPAVFQNLREIIEEDDK